MAKILLAHPLFLANSPEEQAAGSPYFPLGLLYLAAFVRDHGHDVAVFDGTFETDESAFTRALISEEPDLVGISALFPTRETALTLARAASAQGCVVVLGGPDPTASPDLYLSDPSVDIVVHHEGEETVLALLDLFDAGRMTSGALEHEPGIAFRSGDTIRVNEARAPIADLDDLPLPARDLIDMDRYLETWQETSGYSSLTLATSRGCPYECKWCRDGTQGAGFRQRSPESVAAEMKLLKAQHTITRLRIVDDIDGLDRAWLESWAEACESIDAVIPFEALSDLERTDIPMLDVRDSLCKKRNVYFPTEGNDLHAPPRSDERSQVIAGA